jgi:hypothetical protein
MRNFVVRLIFELMFAAVIICSSTFAQQIPSETWMGVYLGNTKVGYSKFAIDRADYHSRPGYRVECVSKTSITALGIEVEQSLSTTVYLDLEFNPVHQVVDMSSGGHTMRVEADFGAEAITAKVTTAGAQSTRTIPIPKGVKIVGDSTYVPSTSKLKVGDKLSYKWFNPLTLTLDDLELEVLRTEELQIGAKTFHAFVVKSTTSTGEVTCWQDENGELLKVQALAGIVMIRESKEEAMHVAKPGSYSPPADLAVITSARTEARIPDPRKVKSMRVRLMGIKADSLILTDKRQKAEYRSDEKEFVEYRIKASEPNASKSPLLPLFKQGLEEYLADTTYIQPSNPEVMRVAKEIVGNEKNAVKVISKLRTWVNKNMQPRGDIGLLRTSVDILRARDGVCRDYAILYTALARSVGIPTRLVAGLVYWKDGFYYHAWAESYAGEWIPVDATLDTDFVDATHIKLAQGDATVMFETLRTVGSLKAEIIDWE